MSNNSEPFNVFDPTGVFKNMRDSGLEAWSKMMLELVNSQAYAEAQGAMLDAWLANSAPFRKALDSAMSQTMANVNVPSREEITRLAERLTNIEMRLDDMDAKLDAVLAEPKSGSGRKRKTSKEED